MSGLSVFLLSSASPNTNRTFGRTPTICWATGWRVLSISTVTTTPAWSASRAVSDPVPVPTSSTASARSNSAARTIRSSRLRSIRKFCPSLVLASSPWASNRLRR
jgi:hypothetical protein